MPRLNIPRLKRTRPEAFDEQDSVDPADLAGDYQADMLKRQPQYMRDLLAERVKPV